MNPNGVWRLIPDRVLLRFGTVRLRLSRHGRLLPIAKKLQQNDFELKTRRSIRYASACIDLPIRFTPLTRRWMHAQTVTNAPKLAEFDAAPSAGLETRSELETRPWCRRSPRRGPKRRECRSPSKGVHYSGSQGDRMISKRS